MPKKRKSDSTTSDNKAEKRENSTIEAKIIDNLVKIQKVHTDLAEKFDSLANEISKLLALFELTARSFAKESSSKPSEKDREFLEKIDKLLEQNKTIAKGLTLMEEKIRQRMYAPAPVQPKESYPENEYAPSMGAKRPLPRF